MAENQNKKNHPESKEHSLRRFLIETQFFRKASIWAYIFSFKILVATAITLFLIYYFGEQYLLWIGIGFMGFVIYSYKKDNINFTFKITRAADRTIFSFFSKMTKKFYNNRKDMLRLEAMSSELLFSEPATKKKKKGQK